MNREGNVFSKKGTQFCKILTISVGSCLLAVCGSIVAFAAVDWNEFCQTYLVGAPNRSGDCTTQPCTQIFPFLGWVEAQYDECRFDESYYGGCEDDSPDVTCRRTRQYTTYANCLADTGGVLKGTVKKTPCHNVDP